MSHNNMDWVLLSLPLQTTFKIPIPNRISHICSHPGGQWSPKLWPNSPENGETCEDMRWGVKKNSLP